MEGGKIEKSTGKTISHCAVAWLSDGKFSGQTITGGADGNLYHWIGVKAKSNVANNKGHGARCARGVHTGVHTGRTGRRPWMRAI